MQDTVKMKRIWLEFQSKDIVVKARLKVGIYTTEKNIPSTWVPIHQMSTTKSLGRGIVTKTIKRKQFLIVPACPITIHKSQGGTFSELVYEYERTHEHSLVYVALSRATSLNGLYLTSPRDDFTFCHGKHPAKSTQPVQQEYQRLRINKLITIQNQIIEKLQAASEKDLIFTVFNCQSLRANAKNLNDPIIHQSQFLLLSETWLENDEEFPNIDDFAVVSKFKNSGDDNMRSGGVAIFLNNKLVHNNDTCVSSNMDTVTYSKTGDSCLFHFNSNGVIIYFICLYIRPNNSVSNIKCFLGQILATYNIKYLNMIGVSVDRANVPLIIASDFNIDFSSTSGKDLIVWLNNSFGLKYCNNNIPTTLNQTIIDGVFYKGLNQIDTYVYISHFSNHKPLISIIRQC